MAICVIGENPNVNADVYEQVMQRVAQRGELPPPGAIVHSPARPIRLARDLRVALASRRTASWPAT